jgi:hypothetical protein
MEVVAFVVRHIFVLDLFLLLVIIGGLIRMNRKDSIFYRVLTPVEARPVRMIEVICNGKAVITAIVLFVMMLFWVIIPNPRCAWAGFFITLSMIFLCFRRLSPVQFIVVCSVIGLNYRIAFYAREFAVMYLLTMVLLTVTYLTNRYMLSEIFRSERIRTAVSIFVLFLLVICSMLITLPISYRLKGLGWF